MQLEVVDCVYADSSCATVMDARVCCSNQANTFRGLDRVAINSCLKMCKTRVVSGRLRPISYSELEKKPDRAVPPVKWPRRVQMIARRRRPGEQGVGDTLARLIGNVKGDKLAKVFARITGKDCGCGDRQKRLNVSYPYTVQEVCY